MASERTEDVGELLLRHTEKAQQQASAPEASAWVSANAGAGKTHVLKTRVLRLLLAGTEPGKILCLTYTKSAAAEMAERVFSDLADWATCDDALLSMRLEKILGRRAREDEECVARRLFARAIETPGGLKVQTIHAFAEQLLQRFPLEAGVAPGFTVLDEEAAAELRREAIDQVLAEAVEDRASMLGQALDTVIAFAAEDGFDDVLTQALSHRSWLESMALIQDEGEASWADVMARYRQVFDVRDGVSRTDIDREIGEVLPDDFLERAVSTLVEGKKTDQKLAEHLMQARRGSTLQQRVEALETAFLTADKSPRKESGLITKAIKDNHGDVAQRLVRTIDRVHALVCERQGLIAVEATMALLTIALEVQQAYNLAKARHAGLDFDDLIQRTESLFAGVSMAEWVLYKLDGGLDHILVDEAQDTSPQQWTIVDHLAREFFSGVGARDVKRTVFAVGDEKQSIYSFQGAAPEMFAEAGKNFEALTTLAGAAWCRVPLTLSFRTVVPILESVDRIFDDPAVTPGLGDRHEALQHRALRIGQAGLVELWPTEVFDEAADVDVWAPLEDARATAPGDRLAWRIADKISSWLSTGERLLSEDRPIRPGDILILVRRRNPFAEPMVAALKAKGIPVAGADRMMLTEQVAVQDLMALGDFLVLPEDDLALATVLKSPLFGLDDDDLLQLAPKRKGMLWASLLGAAGHSEAYAGVADTLKRWRALADLKPPFEFYSALLDRDGMRARLLSRLGPEAIDPIDEFLSLAIAFDDKSIPSMTGFLDFLRKGKRELKRDMEHGRNEVRVMTVHGAKGLEAPIVFLPDTCSGGRGREVGVVEIADDGVGSEALPLCAWTVKGSSKLAPIAGAKDDRKRREGEERNRLLYVAMTRARDRLYISGFEGKSGRAPGCWYDLIETGLEPLLETVDDETGQQVRRYHCPQAVPAVVVDDVGDADHAVVAAPSWANQAVAAETRLTIPITPSQLVPLDYDPSGDPIEPQRTDRDRIGEEVNPSPFQMAREQRLQRGLITHALLEYIPDVAHDDQEHVARAFVAARAGDFNQAVQDEIIRESLAIVRDSKFAAVFGPQARAEVPIVAEIQRPDGDGLPLRITGEIDRLIVAEDEVLIVDYKSNRRAPKSVADVPEAYLYQLAAYRLAASQIFGMKPVRAAILWTEGASILAVPDALLDQYQTLLWELDAPRLDALAEAT